MAKNKIKEINGIQFLIDLKKVSEVMVYASNTNEFFRIRKMDVKKRAAESKIEYHLTNEIYVVGRMVMVVL